MNLAQIMTIVAIACQPAHFGHWTKMSWTGSNCELKILQCFNRETRDAPESEHTDKMRAQKLGECLENPAHNLPRGAK